MPPRMLLTAALAMLAATVAPNVHAGGMRVTGDCGDGSHVAIDWSWSDTSPNPAYHPEWVGWDVVRRPLGECGAFVRVNDASFPRSSNELSSFHTVDTPPATATAYQYRVIPVDAAHQEIHDYFVFDHGESIFYASCPNFSAPIVVGTIEDWGWALAVTPCANGCYAPFYFEPVDELRAAAGTGEAFKLYGAGYCGTVEGCSLALDHWQPAVCGPVPARRPSWAGIKILYR